MRRYTAPCAIVACLLAAPVAADCPVEGLTPIHQLRSHGPDTLPPGHEVRVRGIVTGDFRGRERLGGFWLQSVGPGPDGLPSGVFVHAPESPPARRPPGAGVEVVITAHTAEFRGRRQLDRLGAVRRCAEPGLPEPITLPLPPAHEDALLRHTGLLVRLDGPLTVTGNRDLQRFGSLDLAAGGRLFRPTNAPGIDAAANARRRIVLDDGSYGANPRSTPYLDGDGSRRVGSEVTGLRGILAHAFGAFRIHPVGAEPMAFRDANPRHPPPPKDGLRLAGFNVQNYFVTLGGRGARNPADLERKRGALAAVAAGLDVDLFGLVEIENDPDAVADLARRLGEATGGGPYAHFATAGPIGGDAIRVALLWRPGRIELLAGPFIDDDPVHHRPPVAGHFRFDADGPGEIVAVIHHKSKTGCPSRGDVDRGQGCWNELRTAQSRALAAFLAGIAERTGTDRILVLGDINAYGDEDPVRVLRDAGLEDLIAGPRGPAQRYTYVYEGESGYLDVALASPALAARATRTLIWHINADEPPFLRARRDAPWRSSDHDPVIVDFPLH